MSSIVIAAVPLIILLATVLVVVLRAQRKTRTRRPAREASATIVLEANLWETCTVDSVCEPWARYTTEAVRGFCGVPAGRHRIKTTTDGGEAVLDFVIYPGEVLAWRLDVERARWEPHDLDGDTRALLESAPASATDLAASVRAKVPGWLVHLRTTMSLVATRSNAVPTIAEGDSVDRVRKRFTKLVSRAEVEGSAAEAGHLAEARDLGEALVGRPLTRKEIRSLLAPARELANRLVLQGDTERAMGAVARGLALMPGDPELMVVAGCTLAARGEADEALRALSAGLEREHCLEAGDIARAMRARLDLRSRLGRSVRV